MDSHLLLQLKEGNTFAFSKIYDLLAPHVFNTVFRILGSHDIAADVTQERNLTYHHFENTRLLMKTASLIIMAVSLAVSSTVCAQQPVWNAGNGDGTFTNPILWGDWPDPDIIRVGDEFYLISTSMHYVPGCPILKSKDLVNWEMAGYAIDRYDEDPHYDL